MSELTTVARPYARAAFNYAVEQGAIENWHEMLAFAAEVAVQEDVNRFLKSAAHREQRSEERRVGKECRCRGWPNQQQKKKKKLASESTVTNRVVSSRRVTHKGRPPT